MKSFQKDLSIQLKTALIVPALLTIVTGAFGVYAAVGVAGKVVCGALAVVAAGSILVTAIVMSERISEKIHWLTGVLDAIPFPISVTDKEMNWTFINKPVEDMIKKAGRKCLESLAIIGEQAFVRQKSVALIALRRILRRPLLNKWGGRFRLIRPISVTVAETLLDI